MYIKRKRLILLLGVVWCLLCVGISVLYAEAENPPQAAGYLTHALEREESGEVVNATNIKLPNIFEVMVRFFFALILVVGLIWGIAFFYKKFIGGNYFLPGQSTIINVLEHRYLDAKRSLYLVEVGGKLLVLGAGGEQIGLITEIQDAESKKRILNILETQPGKWKTKEFKNILAGVETPEENNAAPDEVAIKGKNGARLHKHIQKIKRLLNEK